MGFFEILAIAVVTLLVVGPERMPEAVRSAALTIGRLKRSFNSARTEIERHIGADEIRRQLHNEEVMEKLGQLKSGLTDMDQQLRDIAKADEEYEAQFEEERSMHNHSDANAEEEEVEQEERDLTDPVIVNDDKTPTFNTSLNNDSQR